MEVVVARIVAKRAVWKPITVLALALTAITRPAAVVDALAPRGPQLDVSSAAGLRLLVAEENTDPELRVILPGRPASDTTIRVLFPEHVTAMKHGETDAAQLYLFRPGQRRPRPEWRVS